jgi:hypothetical protein
LGVRFLIVLALALTVRAQDERRVVSPNGRTEFRIFVAQSPEGGLSRLAYEALFSGKIRVKTSFLGMNIVNQEPILGQNVGLSSSKTTDGPGYRGLLLDYMQNGSIGRRIDVEVRAYDDRVEFRYIIPRSTALDEILIEDELTEVHGDVQVSEIPVTGFPAMQFRDGVIHLSHGYEGRTPLVCPWRVIRPNPEK